RGVASDLDEVGHARATTARRRRLVLADTHEFRFSALSSGVVDRRQATGPPKISMRSPGLRLTTARFVSLRLPNPVLVRLRLPWRLIVLTAVTVTSKTCSTAILICVLLASGRTR